MDDNVKVALLPMSKRKRARLDRHATDQSNYREDLDAKKAPTREDFGRAALTVVLVFYDEACSSTDDKNPGLELANILRLKISEVLEACDFSREQIVMRFDRMSLRAVTDHQRWRASRKRKAMADVRT